MIFNNVSRFTYDGGMRKVDEKWPYKTKKLFELIENQTNGNVTEFAKKLSVDQQRINRLFKEDKRSGEFPRMSDELEEIIIEVFGISRKYFIMPPVEVEVNPLDNFNSDTKREHIVRKNKDMKPHIPTKAFAGTTGGISEAVLSRDCEYIPIIKAIPNYDYTMNVMGDSMYPKYENGDLIAIRKVIDIIEWGGIYVLDTADGAVVKRLYDDGDRFRCVSINKEYSDLFIDKTSVYGVYKVVGMIRV